MNPAAAIVAGLGLALACPAGAADRTDALEGLDAIAPRVRMEAPDLELPDLSGIPRTLRAWRGHVILLHFFATWCHPCRKELPGLEAIRKRYGEEGLTVLAVAGDRKGAGVVRAFAAELDLHFPILLDPQGEVRNRYEVTGLPFSYLIDRDGRFIAKVIGARDWESRRAAALVEALLQRDARPPRRRHSP